MIIVVAGPTAVGKTKLSLELAKKYNAEIINYDSIQVYKELNIGSAKVTKNEMDGIKHHLIDFIPPSESFTVYDYQKLARAKLDELISQNKNVVLVGGTGLYLKALLYDYKFNEECNNNNYQELSAEKLYKLLLERDANIKIDCHNKRRLIRALEYYDNTRKSINSNNKGNCLLYDAKFIGLNVSRDILYQRINNRVDEMFVCGLEKEARELFDQNILVNVIGYKELFSYFKGDISLDDAKEMIKQNTRRYAKRQLTFFRNQFDINWFETDYNDFNNTVSSVINYIDKGY